MIYVVSDLHGCYDKYMKMIQKIQFKNDDTLYILGDIIDRGDRGITILCDMMNRKNIVPILGNHEYMAYNVLKNLNNEITLYNYNKYLDKDAINLFENWMFNGGIPTFQELTGLTDEERKSIIEFLGNFDFFKEIEVAGNKFILVHGGLIDFEEMKPLKDYDIHSLVWGRCDYKKQYYPDKYLVTGHTPTHNIDKEYMGKIYKKNNHIAIDCGVVHGGRLGCVCLDTLEEFYV